VSLDESTLALGIAAMGPAATEQAAIDAFVSAWNAYFAGASLADVSAVEDSYSAGLSAMRSALIGMSAPGGGAAKIQSGVTAFWGGIASAGTTMWPVPPPAVVAPTVAPPPALGTIALGLTPVFAANVAASLSLADAADAIAAVLHATGGLGGLVNVTIPPAGPVPVPIL
jgi:hypothetical protein